MLVKRYVKKTAKTNNVHLIKLLNKLRLPIDVFILIFKLFETKTMLITFEVHNQKTSVSGEIYFSGCD